MTADRAGAKEAEPSTQNWLCTGGTLPAGGGGGCVVMYRPLDGDLMCWFLRLVRSFPCSRQQQIRHNGRCARERAEEAEARRGLGCQAR